MIKVKKLRELLSRLPDEACAVAYEGEGVGLRIIYGDKFGWIATGPSDDIDEGSDESDLSVFEASEEKLR